MLEGLKTVESRFGLQRRRPYQRVQPGDIILLKRSGGAVEGLALATAAEFHRLSPGVLADIRRRFAIQLFARDDKFWSSRADKRYATLIELGDVARIEPMSIPKRDRQGWLTLPSECEDSEVRTQLC